jgi:hypothetical protein
MTDEMVQLMHGRNGCNRAAGQWTATLDSQRHGGVQYRWPERRNQVKPSNKLKWTICTALLMLLVLTEFSNDKEDAEVDEGVV